MSGFTTVLVKEVRDNFRDRRTILSSFSLAVLGPVLFIGLMSFVLNTALGESSEPAELSISGSAHAPDLVAYLESQNTEITYIESEDPRADVANRRHDLILAIPEDYQVRFTNGQMVPVTLWHDSSQIGSSRRNFPPCAPW